MRGFRALGFKVEGFRALGLKVGGFWALALKVEGFRALGFGAQRFQGIFLFFCGVFFGSGIQGLRVWGSEVSRLRCGGRGFEGGLGVEEFELGVWLCASFTV